MIGLEYILSLYNLQHVELADMLGIKKQNINMWVKQKQNIPKKYLPVLEKLFDAPRDYFGRELNEIEKLEIQKEKLKKDLNPVIKKHEEQFEIGEVNNIVAKPIYDKEEMNHIEREIEKAKIVSKFKEAIDIIDNNPYMDTYKLLVELMSKVQHEAVLHKTIEALAHYYEVLPDWVNSEPEQEEFETEIYEVFDDHNY